MVFKRTENGCKCDVVANISPQYNIVAVLDMPNGCCADKPVIVTSNPARDVLTGYAYTNYSCQCACNGKCTSGNRTIHEAISEYNEMTAKYQERALNLQKI